MGTEKQSSQTREQKRAQFSDSAKSKGNMTPILIAVLVALIGFAVYMVISSSGDQPQATEVTTTGGASNDIRIPLADLDGGKAKFFDYTLANNTSIRFFAIKSPDGVYRAALDACDVCFHAKKGYTQEGEEMVCNNCGLKFHANLINEVQGGCNPVGIPRTIEGGNLVIKASDLESRGGYYF